MANVVLIKCADQLVPYLGPIFRATFSLCIYPDTWKEFETIVLRKPGKMDYMIPNAYQPIALLDVITKVLSACVKETQYFTVPHLFLQESSHSSRIPVESIGIPLEFHWNKNGIKHTKVDILLYLSQFSSCADIYTFLFPCHFYTMFTPVLYP